MVEGGQPRRPRAISLLHRMPSRANLFHQSASAAWDTTSEQLRALDLHWQLDDLDAIAWGSDLEKRLRSGLTKFHTGCKEVLPGHPVHLQEKNSHFHLNARLEIMRWSSSSASFCKKVKMMDGDHSSSLMTSLTKTPAVTRHLYY